MKRHTMSIVLATIAAVAIATARVTTMKADGWRSCEGANHQAQRSMHEGLL
jgi:hypothetical protein